MKLWEKSTTDTHLLVEQFTVGNDRAFDLVLARYDVLGSLAHTEMLCKAGLLQPEEQAQIHIELKQILADIEAGTFVLEQEVEDVHSQVELLLTRRLGDTGKKVHSGRSRNDQVAVDIKLYLKDTILQVKEHVGLLFDDLIGLSRRYEHVLMPGYTHLQVAMPSSFGLWLSAYAEALTDDLEMLAAAFAVADKNPLGSGAGYGSSFPLDRELTTHLLGFQQLHYNVINAQMSRGKTEKYTAYGLAAVAGTLGRLAMDICLYMGQDFNFLRFPDALTTGSSIMPHKKNPDLFELVRARCNRIQSMPNELTILLANLPAGYHRDLQLTKEILMPGIQSMIDCLEMLHFALPQMLVRENILEDPRYRYLFTVEAVNALVQKGIPFRDAYRQIGNEVETDNFVFNDFDRHMHTLHGSMGNLCLEYIEAAMQKVMRRFEAPYSSPRSQ